MCGAPAATDSTQCAHCQARLATVACPSCFGMLFLGAKFCPHCGAPAARHEATAEAPLSCPTCRLALQAVLLGSAQVQECSQCSGLWVDVETLQKICADREKQAAVLGGATPDPLATPSMTTLEVVRYRPCPVCQTLMNRVNFSERSGVIIDVCRGHGTWFDREELRRIVEFIRAGGLEANRARDLQHWATEKRRMTAPSIPLETPLSGDATPHHDLGDIIFDLGRALFDLLKR